MAQTRQNVEPDFTGFYKKLEALGVNVTEAAEELVKEISEDGAKVARLALANANTSWGEDRMSRGQGLTSGRADTGRMLHRLRALKPKRVDSNTIRASIGWYYADEYFKYQERGIGSYATDPNDYDPNFQYRAIYGVGFGNIVGAHSLWTARSWMERNMKTYERNFLNRVRRASK